MRFLATLCLAVMGVCAFGAPPRITARAGFSIQGEHEIGAASIVMDVTGTTGSFQFAAEDHGDHLLCATDPHGALVYPEIVVRSTRIRETRFQGRRFTMTADGWFQGDPCVIDVVATDGGRRGDTFEIICKSPNGVLLYQRSAKIQTGDIRIK